MRVFKKSNTMFALIIALIAFISAPAFACNPGEACWNKNYSNNANSFDSSISGTTKSFSTHTYNDNAGASANGGASSMYGGYAGGSGWLIKNTVVGAESNSSKSTVDAFAKDSGYTSQAGAIAKQESQGQAAVVAGGLGFGSGVAKTQTEATVFGNVSQGNIAKEVGYNGANATAGNSSAAGYQGIDTDENCKTGTGLWGAESHSQLSGDAITGGYSTVTVDPNGSHRSAEGFTTNFAKADVDGADRSETYVNGSGGVGTESFIGYNNNGAYSGGQSSFSYDGSDFGTGMAAHSSYVNHDTTCNTSTSSAGSQGFATSFVVNSNNNQPR